MVQFLGRTTSLENKDTKQRELRALHHAMEEMKLSVATIITIDKEEEIYDGDNLIRIIPAWKFFLQ